MTDVITVEQLTVVYDKAPVLDRVNFHVPQSCLMAIVGPNGAGKSTLLKGLLNIVKAQSGSVRFHIGHPMTLKEAKKHIAYVPQNGSVHWDFPATVFDIVLMGRYGHLGWFRRPSLEDKLKVEAVLHRVGLWELKHRQISELSGGQQQRVFLARALVQEAEVYLLDEPLKGIDVTTEKVIIQILKELQQEGKTIVVVHHALRTVPDYFDQIALIGDGNLIQGLIADVFTEENIAKTFHYGGR